MQDRNRQNAVVILVSTLTALTRITLHVLKKIDMALREGKTPRSETVRAAIELLARLRRFARSIGMREKDLPCEDPAAGTELTLEEKAAFILQHRFLSYDIVRLIIPSSWHGPKRLHVSSCREAINLTLRECVVFYVKAKYAISHPGEHMTTIDLLDAVIETARGLTTPGGDPLLQAADPADLYRILHDIRGKLKKAGMRDDRAFLESIPGVGTRLSVPYFNIEVSGPTG